MALALLVAAGATAPAAAPAQVPVGRPDTAAVVPDPGLAPGAVHGLGLPAWAAPAIGQLEKRLAEDAAADGVGSMAAAVFVGDSVVWQAAFGVADRASGRLAAPTTVYRAGSISKPFTALTLLALVDLGVVGLDDPVEPHVPELRHLANRPPDARPITFRQLAAHTSGLAREPALSHAGRGPYAGWRGHLLAAIPATEVAGPPGEAYRYSNIGYALLGLALERAAGRPFEELVSELVLEPLGLRSTWFVVPGPARHRLAEGYVNLAGDTIDPRVPRAEHRGRGYRPPSGGLYSTVGDLARLGMAMTGALGELPVTATRRAEALTDQAVQPTRTGPPALLPNPAPPLRLGYGLGFQLHRVGRTMVAGHSGTVPGYTGYLAFDPVTGVGVVVLRNYNHGVTNLGALAAGFVLELAGSAADALP